MTKGYSAVLFNAQDKYQGVYHGRTRDEAIRNVKFYLLDTAIYGAVTPGMDDVMDMPNGHVQFPVGDEMWTAEVSPIDFER